MTTFNRPNQVPQATFNLREEGPLKTHDVLARCEGKAYRAAFGNSEPGITIDRDPCPLCAEHGINSPVEWAFTMKREGDYHSKKQNYVYARCTLKGKEHRWGFKQQGAQFKEEPIKLTEHPVVKSVFKPEYEPLPHATESAIAQPTPTLPEAPQMPTATAAQSQNSNPIEAWITGIIGSRLDQHEAKILQMAKEIGERTPLTVTLTVLHDKDTFIIEGLRHPIVDELIERYALGERTFMLVGPAGTGKTTIARQVAGIIKARRVTLIACSEDMRRETFVGHKAYNVQNGTTPYQPSALVEDLRTEGVTVTILEEVDAASPNALLTINALENGFLPTPDCAEMPTHPRPVDHVLIATANTWGTAGSTSYVGRNQLDAATLDRYTTMFVDYDPALEKALIGDVDVYKALLALRGKVASLGLRKVVSTRLGRRVVTSRKLTANKSKGAVEILNATLKNMGWSEAELSRVGAS